jgi:hypothetical protein
MEHHMRYLRDIRRRSVSKSNLLCSARQNQKNMRLSCIGFYSHIAKIMSTFAKMTKSSIYIAIWQSVLLVVKLYAREGEVAI